MVARASAKCSTCNAMSHCTRKTAKTKTVATQVTVPWIEPPELPGHNSFCSTYTLRHFFLFFFLSLYLLFAVLLLRQWHFTVWTKYYCPALAQYVLLHLHMSSLTLTPSMIISSPVAGTLVQCTCWSMLITGLGMLWVSGKMPGFQPWRMGDERVGPSRLAQIEQSEMWSWRARITVYHSGSAHCRQWKAGQDLGMRLGHKHVGLDGLAELEQPHMWRWRVSIVRICISQWLHTLQERKGRT